jgi:hypothetical protein
MSRETFGPVAPAFWFWSIRAEPVAVEVSVCACVSGPLSQLALEPDAAAFCTVLPPDAESCVIETVWVALSVTVTGMPFLAAVVVEPSMLIAW